jgi:replicative DNA helicase
MEITNRNKELKSRRKAAPDLSAMVYGKIPPQARELEEAVLGAIMLEKTALDVGLELLKPECFYVEAHQRIFNAIKFLSNADQPVDILTVVEALRKREELDLVGGPYFVTKLTNTVVSTANIEAHARIVLQKFIQRELIRISGEIIGDAYEDSTDVFDLLDDAESKLFEITNNHLRKNFDSIDSVLVKTFNRIEDMRSRKDEISGVPSGFPKLDAVTYGWQPTDLIILAARPAVGKTAFALNLARSAALNPTKPTGVAFFSLEMSASQLVGRILAAESGVALEKITRGTLQDHEMEQLHRRGMERLANAPIFIDDTAALNIFELRAKCRRLKNKHNIGLIIIDYLQLMSGSGDRGSNREQEISQISRSLKGLAKELGVPIIALSQLSRAVETRKEGNKVPQLSDLRESGAIEQDADMVMFLYRPDYYDNAQNEHGEGQKGLTQVKIAKHRNGSLETIDLRALLHLQKFEEWGDQDHGFGPSFMPANLRGDGPTAGPDSGARLYNQFSSKMNGMQNDDDDIDPF